MRRGFTLLELLVVLALLALLGVTLTGAVGFGDRVWHTAADRGERIEEIVRAEMTIRRQLGSIVPAGALGSVNGRPALFFGAADGLGWVARSPNQAWQPGLYGQRLLASERGGEPLLMLESWPLSNPSQVRRSPLLRGHRIAFAYFGRHDERHPLAWHRHWPSGPIPPRLVRIEIMGKPAAPLMIFLVADERSR